jgi:UDP-N-acetylglucosamine 3-dehydrogenase
MSALRAAVIGYGQMGRHHARVLSTLPGVELVGVAEPNPPERASMRFVADIDVLLSEGIDLAVVAVPTALHEAVAVRLAEAGVHALVEKPVAPDVPASERMADAFEAAGLVGCVGHIERYNPAVRELRRRITAGELGDVYQIATRRQGPFPERIQDVGVILDLATHDIDLTSFVSRSPYADISVRTTSKSGRECEDLVAAVGRLEDGTVVSHLVNWLSPFKERVTIVAGERGCFVADTLTADLTFHANGVAPVVWETMASFRGVVVGDVTRYAIAKQEPLQIELSAFRDAVLGEGEDVVGIRDAARTVAVAEAMMRGAESSEKELPA